MSNIELTLSDATSNFILTEVNDSTFILTGSNTTNVNLVKNSDFTGNVSLKGADALRGLTAFVSGRPLASEIVIGGIAPYDLTLSAANSVAKCVVPGDSDATFTIKNNDSNIGTIFFPAFDTDAIIVYSNRYILKGDVITVHAPLVPDGSLADLTFLLV